MGLIQILEILAIDAAGLAALLVVRAWQTRLVRVRLIATCLALGVVALLVSFLLGRVIPVGADSLDFARGLSLGFGIGLFLGIAVLFLVETVERNGRAA